MSCTGTHKTDLCKLGRYGSSRYLSSDSSALPKRLTSRIFVLTTVILYDIASLCETYREIKAKIKNAGKPMPRR